MDLSSLISRPKIEFASEHVELPDPPEVLTETQPVYSNKEDDVIDVREAIEYEVAQLDKLIEAVLETIPEVVVQSDVSGDPQTVTLSDYLQAMTSEDYGPQSIRDIYEEGACDSHTGEPAVLMIPLLSDMRDVLTRDIEMIGSSVFYGEFDASGAKDSTLWAIRSEIAESQKLREEVLRAAVYANKAIDAALWAKTLDVRTMDQLYAQGSKLIYQLRRMQSLLRIATGLYSTDWKNSVSSIRDRVYSALMSRYLDRVLSVYSRTYNKVVQPAFDTLTFLNNRVLDDIEEVQSLKDILATSVMHVDRRLSDVLSDVYAIRVKRSAFRIHGVRAAGVMVYTKRLADQLDIVIAGVQTALTGGSIGFPLECPAPRGRLGVLLENKEFSQMTPTDETVLVEGSPKLDDVIDGSRRNAKSRRTYDVEQAS